MDALERLVEGLDARQREAVLSPGAPLAVIAPAGSGKTRVLTRRIARRVLEGDADARHVLAITFTRRAASELGRRLRDLGLRDRPTVGTFHAVALSVLRQRWADLGRPAPEVLADPGRMVGRLVDQRGRSATRVHQAEVQAEIGWARARLVAPERYEAEARRAGRRPTAGLDAVAELYAAYAEAKRAARVVDFDDLLALCTAEIRRDPSFAEAQRWRFRHLFVDEFQDVNPLQHALLEAWRGGRPDLCVVGDPNQAIYAWNGADASWLRDFAAHHGGATIVRLERSYRSTPEVLASAHAVLARTDAADPTPESVRPGGALPAVHAFADERAEALGIAAVLRTAHVPGRRWSSCAVLVRTHQQAAIVEQGLRAAGVPARVRGRAGAGDQPVVRSLLREFTGPLRDLAETLDAGTELPPATARTISSLAWEHLADDPGATVETFRLWLASGDADADDTDAVDVLTFHAAKGLEWPVVVVAGLERGLVPHASAKAPEARAEELRLLYVALTRAEQELHVTWARNRNGRPRTPSPLLAAVEEGRRAEPPAPPPPGLVEAAPRPERTTLAALEAWRTAAAKAAGLPERAVCSDDALRAVARDLPATVEELAAIPEVGPLAAHRLGPRMLAALEAI